MNRNFHFFWFIILCQNALLAQSTKITSDRLYDGTTMQTGYGIVVEGNLIREVGLIEELPDADTLIALGNVTLMPGMIEGHSHILLHPYNETGWNDQVLKESMAERAIRGAIHCEQSVKAGFTTLRDLGSEGADYTDVGVKQAIDKGLIIGPRLVVAGRALVTSGSYGPKGFAPHVSVPLGAEVADGDALIRIVRDQIGKGADVVKVYADYRWGPFGQALPTYTLEELKTIVEVANSSGRPVVAHAATAEGMRRATLAGVQTIEHGDGGTKEVFELMKELGVALCPTLAAGDAIMQYRGWQKGIEPDPERIVHKKKSFAQALAVGVDIIAGGDVGVFTHGENVIELEMMVEYGMNTGDVLKSVTSENAKLLGLEDRGALAPGLLADIIAVKGNPAKNIADLRQVEFVMKDGDIIK